MKIYTFFGSKDVKVTGMFKQIGKLWGNVDLIGSFALIHWMQTVW